MKERSALAISPAAWRSWGTGATPLPPIPWLWPTPSASRTSSWRPLFYLFEHGGNYKVAYDTFQSLPTGLSAGTSPELMTQAFYLLNVKLLKEPV